MVNSMWIRCDCADYDLSKFRAKRYALEEREVIVVVEGQELPYPNELEELGESEYGARMLVPSGCS